MKITISATDNNLKEYISVIEKHSKIVKKELGKNYGFVMFCDEIIIEIDNKIDSLINLLNDLKKKQNKYLCGLILDQLNDNEIVIEIYDGYRE